MHYKMCSRTIKEPLVSLRLHQQNENHYAKHAEFEGCDKASWLKNTRWQQLQSRDIKTIMVVSIGEVVNVVSCNCIDTIVECSLMGSLTSPCKVCLQSWGASIEIA